MQNQHNPQNLQVTEKKFLNFPIHCSLSSSCLLQFQCFPISFPVLYQIFIYLDFDRQKLWLHLLIMKNQLPPEW